MQCFKHRCPNPKCRALLSIPEETRGHSARCAKCEQSFFVPFILESAGKNRPHLRKAG
jgi:hypothetical protein